MGIGGLASVDDVISYEDGGLARGAALDERLELLDELSDGHTERVFEADSWWQGEGDFGCHDFDISLSCAGGVGVRCKT